MSDFTDEQIKHMVERFLCWKLPENFNPDCGISFKRAHSEHGPFGPQKYEPVGTNLFDYGQAKAMVQYMIEALSGAPDASNASADAIELAYGLLWVVGCDRSTKNGNALYLARKALYEQIDKAGQARGITAAKSALSPAGADEGKESEGAIPSGYGEYTPITVRGSTTPPDATAQREAIARIIGSFPTHPHDGDEQYVLHDAFPGDYDRRTAKIYELTDAVLLTLSTRARG